MSNDIYSAVYMAPHGISTLAIVPHQHLEDLRKSFISEPDSVWCNGRGKNYMHAMLKRDLLVEDAYFEAHIEEAVSTNSRWDDFLQDCAIFAVLDEVLTGNPLLLLHPSCMKNIQHPDMPPIKQKLSLIDGIGIIN